MLFFRTAFLTILAPNLPSAMSHKPVWILVPGALHPGPLYQPLLDEIAKHGYETLALTNPSLGGPDQKKLSCSDDAHHARGKILQYLDQDRDVVVVCHSYGGMVSGAAVYGLSKKERLTQGKQAGVVGHIYLSAVLNVKSIGNEVEMHPPSFLELNHVSRFLGWGLSACTDPFSAARRSFHG